jgi:4-amino-4-deoxy-L-arabinose transferase-like glycosyltransferase
VEVDKRPWFYPFLVSIVHDLTGYRETNAFLVNALAGIVFLAGAYLLGHRIGGTRGAVLSVLLWLTLPLLAQNATGAGMEMVNLLLIQALLLLSIRYLDRPDRAAEGALSLTAVLLAYTRYESALFILPVAIVIVLGWFRGGKILLSWGTILAGPLLVAVAVQNRIYSGTEHSWELIDGAVRPFSFAHIAENFPHALHFFFNAGDGLANSLLVSVLGVPAVLMFVLVVRREARSFWKERTEGLVLALFGLFLLVHLLVVLAFHASKFDSLYVSRYALPIHLLLVPAIVFVLCEKVRAASVWKGIFTVAAVFLLTFTQPHKAKAIYTKRNFVVREMNWLRGLSASEMEAGGLVVDYYRVPWSLREWEVVTPAVAAANRKTILGRMEDRSYPAVYAVQRLDFEGGAFLDELPASAALLQSLEVELLDERSFRPFELTRLYRVLGPAGQEAAKN